MTLPAIRFAVRRATHAFLSVCAAAGALGAQAGVDAAAGGGASPSAVAARRASLVAIDGRLDETAWQAATPITTLRQRQPVEGAAASLATDIRILFDDRALYVGARLSDPQGRAGVRAPPPRGAQQRAGNRHNRPGK